MDVNLRQEIYGLVTENHRLREQHQSAQAEIKAYKGEVDNAHNRLITTKDALTQTEHQALTLSQCVIDLALVFDALADFSDDIMAGNWRAIALHLASMPQPVQNSLTSWRYGTCTEARRLAEAYRDAGKL